MSQPKKQHSIDEYRQAVKILKLNAMQLVEQNKEIERKIEGLESRRSNTSSAFSNQIGLAVQLSSNREALSKIKADKQSAQIKQDKKTNTDSDGSSSVARKEVLLRQLKKLLQSKGLNYEMLFRCCDYNYTKQINVENLKHFLLTRISKNEEITLEQVTLIAQSLDEDCSGQISFDEFNRCITFYNLNEARNKLTLQRAQEKEVMFRIVKFFDTITKTERISFANIFDTIASPQALTLPHRSPTPQAITVPVTVLQHYFEYHHIELKDQEMYAVSRVLDPLKTGQIEKKAFVREMNNYHKMQYEIDIDREMQSFASLLAQFKVDPIQVFKIADIEDSKCVNKALLVKAIVKLAPRISAQLLDHFLSIIDVNNNGEIDENEYLVALSQDENQVLFENSNLSSSISQSERQRILDKMHTFMTKNSLTSKELFAKIDRNGNGDISLIEMKFSLLDLGFELPQIAQIMKIFDTNSDQKISYPEFSELLDHAKMLQHGFEKDISEAHKHRKAGGSHASDLKSQEELSQVINQSKSDLQKNNHDTPNRNELVPPSKQPYPSINLIPNSNRVIPNSKQKEEPSYSNDIHDEPEQEAAPAAAPASKNDTYAIHIQNEESNAEAEEQQDGDNDQSIQMQGYDEEFEEADDNPPPQLKKNKSSLKVDVSFDDDGQLSQCKSHTSGSSKKSVKFNLFDEADIQELILNEEVFDFNKFYEDLGKERFTDSDFPPTIASLTSSVKRFPKAKNLTWKSLSEIDQTSKVFEGKVEPCDIKQGGLGDCYFLSSLSVLAERENLIKRLFVTKDQNPLGCYSVWLCRDSEWIQFTLDDQVPCEKHGKEESPAFSRSNGSEMWVLLLEKCYAKMYGNYENIEAGQTIEAIKDLTGAPGKSIKNEGDLNLIWEFIITNERKNYVLTCGSQSDDRGMETKKESGIVSSHAYGILDAREVKTEKGQVARLIKIRNPWGSMEWKGDWSDKSSKWTPKIRKEIDYFSEEDDGIFWMEVKDYAKEFSETSVNYLHDDYFYSWLKLPNFTNKQAIVQFVVKTETHAYIMFSQKSDRHFHHTEYKYSNLKAFLVEINPTSLEPIRYITDLFTPFREEFIEVNLSQGTYGLAIEADWIQDIDQTAVVSIYSNEKVNLQQHGFLMNPSQGFLNFLCAGVALKDFSKSKSVKINSYEESSEIVQYYEQFGGYVFFTYVNSSKNATLDEEIELKGTGVELVDRPEIYTSPVENSFAISVPPQSTKVALYKMTADSKGSIQFTIGTSYSISVNESMEELIEKFAADPDKGDKRENRGKQVDYYFKVCQYQGGFVLLYQNLTKNLIGKENIEFENTNLQIKNPEFAGSNDKVTFSVKPQDKFAIILQVIDKSSQSGLSYSESGTQFSKA